MRREGRCAGEGQSRKGGTGGEMVDLERQRTVTKPLACLAKGTLKEEEDECASQGGIDQNESREAYITERPLYTPETRRCAKEMIADDSGVT